MVLFWQNQDIKRQYEKNAEELLTESTIISKAREAVKEAQLQHHLIPRATLLGNRQPRVVAFTSTPYVNNSGNVQFDRFDDYLKEVRPGSSPRPHILHPSVCLHSVVMHTSPNTHCVLTMVRKTQSAGCNGRWQWQLAGNREREREREGERERSCQQH